MTKSRNINRPRWKPDAVALELITRNFANSRTQDLADALGVAYSQVAKLAQKLGLKKCPEWMASGGGNYLDGTKGAGWRFKPGHASWIKGKKMGPEWGKKTHFKPGQRSINWQPIGSYRVAAGYLQIKLHDTGYHVRDWVMVHRHVWEQAHGPIPAGMRLAFKPGRFSTEAAAITPDALELVTPAEVMRRNTRHNLPPELNELIYTRAALTRAINSKAKEQP